MRLKAEVADESVPAQTPAGSRGELDRTDHFLADVVGRIASAEKLRKNGHLSPPQLVMVAW